jgi:hypothetical protein
MTTYAPLLPTTDPFVLSSGSGRLYIVEQSGPKSTRRVAGPFATARLAADALTEMLYGPEEGPTCSICDALGHGYPGAGPCPLEDRGSFDPGEFIFDAARVWA